MRYLVLGMRDIQYLGCEVFSIGWSGVANVSCILRHWGVQLIARPAILVAGKGRRGE